MERPNRDKILQELKDMNHVAYGSYVEQEYHKRLELYVTHLEKQLLLHNVVVPKGTLPKCEHKNIDRQDGCDECLDCGVRNY